jgi:hypothetical protein
MRRIKKNGRIKHARRINGSDGLCVIGGQAEVLTRLPARDGDEGGKIGTSRKKWKLQKMI